jgi:hypothetical protein
LVFVTSWKPVVSTRWPLPRQLGHVVVNPNEFPIRRSPPHTPQDSRELFSPDDRVLSSIDGVYALIEGGIALMSTAMSYGRGPLGADRSFACLT